MDITVAIGRNVGDQPMSDEQWFRYKADVNAIVARNGFTVYNREEGDSTYAYDGSWQTERFHRIWAGHVLPGAPDIRPELAKLAKEYKQWGIAYTVAKLHEVVEAS